MIVVDSSALLAVFFEEPEKEAFKTSSTATSVASYRRTRLAAGGKQSAGTLAYIDTIARKHLISDATKSANARTRGVCCISRCMSR
jgi:hypothetical protein